MIQLGVFCLYKSLQSKMLQLLVTYSYTVWAETEQDFYFNEWFPSCGIGEISVLFRSILRSSQQDIFDLSWLALQKRPLLLKVIPVLCNLTSA